jgi:hypothetical protein
MAAGALRGDAMQSERLLSVEALAAPWRLDHFPASVRRRQDVTARIGGTSPGLPGLDPGAAARLQCAARSLEECPENESRESHDFEFRCEQFPNWRLSL